jgi:hypothetical protein
MDSAINIGLIITYLAIGLALLGAIVFPIIQMAGDIKSAKGVLIGIVAFVAIFLLSYLLSSPETGAFYEAKNVSPNFARIIGAGLIATYIVFAGAVVAILYSQITKWIK